MVAVWFRTGVSESRGGRISSHTDMAPRLPPRQWQVWIPFIFLWNLILKLWFCHCWRVSYNYFGGEFPGRITWRPCRRHAGSTARVRFTAGATSARSRKPPRGGSPRFRFSNLTGRFVWRAVFLQVRFSLAIQISKFNAHRLPNSSIFQCIPCWLFSCRLD